MTIAARPARALHAAPSAPATDARGRIDTNYQLFGNVSLTKGRHSFKTGYEWRRTFINSFINSGHRGKLVFDSLGDFLAGNLDTSSSSSAYGASTLYSYQNGGGAYFMDAWHMNPKIMVNYGLRWDYFGVIGAKNNAFSLFDFKTATVNRLGTGGAPSSLYPKDWLNFAPRFSLADDLMGNGKLVVRTGAGIFYDGASQDFFVGNQAYNTYAGQRRPRLQLHRLCLAAADRHGHGLQRQSYSSHLPGCVHLWRYPTISRAALSRWIRI